MLNEKKEILCRIHNKINRRKSEMLSRFSRINKLTDDFIFRMFNTLIEYNDGDDKIRYKKINNNSDTNDIILLFYIPKGTYFEKLKKEYVNTIICLSGCVEIEFNGKLFTYQYKKPVVGRVVVAVVTLQKGVFTIEHKLPANLPDDLNRKLWNLESNNFHKVNLVCVSPNHWGNNAVGNKHYMFMLEGCKTDKNVRGFHNENLATYCFAP